MAFPTTSVLTSFTGTDEEPLSEGGIWLSPIQSGINAARRLSNAAARATSGTPGTSQSYRNTSYGADLEAYATIAVVPETTKVVSIFGRIHNPGNASTAEAYVANYTTDTGFRLFKMLTGDSFTQLGTTDTTVAAAGDGIGLECIGTAIKLYRRASGVWTASAQAQATDAGVTGAGFIGIEFLGTVGRLDDFGGGEIVIPPTSRPGDMLMLGVS